MSNGFKPILDDCELTLGALDPDDTRHMVNISLSSEEMGTGVVTEIKCDVAGINEIADVCQLLVFNWRSVDMDVVERMAEDDPEMTVEEARAEVDGPVMMLERVIPYDRVRGIRVNDHEVFK